MDEHSIDAVAVGEAKGTDKSHMQQAVTKLYANFPEKYLHGFNPIIVKSYVGVSAYESGVELQLMLRRTLWDVKLARPTFVATETPFMRRAKLCVGKRDARLVELEERFREFLVVWAGTAHVADPTHNGSFGEGTAHLGMAVIDWEFGQPQGEMLIPEPRLPDSMVRIAAVDPSVTDHPYRPAGTVVLRDS
ncbi:hypothetical protein SPFM8_00199 [Salmonella phage SPFM8]|nr:hypothetical protein SPFM8_00199 [Salmonella phage SPFM8]